MVERFGIFCHRLLSELSRRRPSPRWLIEHSGVVVQFTSRIDARVVAWLPDFFVIIKT